APVMALLSDLTRDSQRTKAMAVIGVTIGASFIVSIVIGPVIGAAIGVSGIFWITAIGSLLAIAVLYGAVPSPTHRAKQTERNLALFIRTLSDPQLSRLDVGIFVLHTLFSAMFITLP